MQKTNRELFDGLSPDSYFKSVKLASKTFGEIRKFPGSLGFDKESNGFLVLHRKHAPSAFNQEIPVCLVLKKLGFRVVLEAEKPHQGSADALIDNEKFEIKQVSNAQNFKRAVEWHFRSAYHKSSRLLLHVVQTVNEMQLRGALLGAVKNVPAIKIVWIVFNGELFQFDREEILKNRHRFSAKK